MKFRTQYQQLDIKSNPGNRYREVFSPEFNDAGVLVFEPVAKEDIDEYIQSFAAETDINLIIERYVKGDVDVLNQVEGFYADATVMPKSYQDVLNMNIKVENFFDGLPVDVKQEFDNSYEQFMVSLGEKDFMERIKRVVNGSDASSGTNVKFDDPVPVSGTGDDGKEQKVGE